MRPPVTAVFALKAFAPAPSAGRPTLLKAMCEGYVTLAGR
jgi:hypothetical protein